MMRLILTTITLVWANCDLTEEEGHGWSACRSRIRTTDTRIFNPLLYQLSYPGVDGRTGHQRRCPQTACNGIARRPVPVQTK